MSSVCLQRAARACGAVCLAVCLVGGALACLPRRTGERSFPCAVARAHRALPAADGARESLPAADGVFAAECGVSAAGQAFVRAPGAIRPA